MHKTERALRPTDVGVHLHYDSPLGRLSDVKRVVDNHAVETLVQYRYDAKSKLIAVTDALNQTTTLERKPDGKVLRIQHPDGSAESFTYNALYQVLTHADGKGQTTRLLRTARGLPSSRQDAKGQRIRYEYDPAIRLTALVNENNAAYQFAYDASDRLVEEKRIDNLTRRFSYNLGGHLTRVDEIGYGERGERPQRHTEFERDAIGRLLAKLNTDARQDYTYDDADRLLTIERLPTAQGKKLGVSEETLEFSYDLLGRLIKETTPQGALSYEYDPLSNLTTLTLPTGQHLNHLYYGSGHLHQLNLDGQLISDIERDDLHREVYRTQGTLTSCFGYDAMGRKAWQFASTLPAEKLSQIHNPGIQPALLVEHAYNPIHRRHQYDPAGELTRTLDKLRGEIKYEYEANGQLHSRDTGMLVDSEEFRYDAAANRLNFNTSQFDHVKDNRIKQWRDQEYAYDPWGNLVEKRSGMNRLQTFTYDCENRLVKAETLVGSKLESIGDYRYDSLGRRVSKVSEVNGKTEQKHFLWQGLRLLREETPGQSSLYVYEPGSYAPNTNGWIDPLGWCVTTSVTRGAAGQPLKATATITPKDLGTGTATNESSRFGARSLGNSDDDAGHIIGKLLGGSGGKDGVFPQLSKVNRGLFRDHERQIFNDISKNGPVDVELMFKYGAGGTRPTKIFYNLFRNGELLDGKVFLN